MKKAVVVASGSSAASYRAQPGLTVIAVNGAIDWIDRADYWFTLDPSAVNMERMLHRRPSVSYNVACERKHIESIPSGVTLWERVEAPGLKFLPGSKVMFNKDGKFTCAQGLNEEWGKINSGNSAFGALGLAYHLGFTDVALVGVDGTRLRRMEGGFSRDLRHLPQLFESAAEQINIYNCGLLPSQIIPRTTLRAFAKIGEQ